MRALLPQDFEDIGERSRPHNYFGLIYADGNRMGETIRAMAARFPGDEEARGAYRAFSRIVDRATREAAVEAVLERVETSEVETVRVHLFMAVPAGLALMTGQLLNNVNAVQTYEMVTTESGKRYRPAALLHPAG